MSLVLGVLGWFSHDYLAEQKKFNEAVSARVNKLELQSAKDEGSRFTSGEWNASKAIIDATFASQDKRITRSEDAQAVIEKSLIRIENKIDGLTK